MEWEKKPKFVHNSKENTTVECLRLKSISKESNVNQVKQISGNVIENYQKIVNTIRMLLLNVLILIMISLKFLMRELLE